MTTSKHPDCADECMVAAARGPTHACQGGCAYSSSFELRKDTENLPFMPAFRKEEESAPQVETPSASDGQVAATSADLRTASLPPATADQTPRTDAPRIEITLHELWGAAVGTPGYNKSKWQVLQHWIWEKQRDLFAANARADACQAELRAANEPHDAFCPHCNPCRHLNRINDYDSVLRGLASFVGAGGFSSTEWMDAKTADDKIRWGIQHLTDVEAARRQAAERERDALQQHAEAMASSIRGDAFASAHGYSAYEAYEQWKAKQEQPHD